MATEPAKPEPTQKPPSRFWKWTRRVGCVLILLTLTCCLTTCTAGWLMERGIRKINGDEMDRIHAEAVRGGDIKAMHDRADARFRQRFTLEDLEKFLNERPGILERDNFRGVDFRQANIDGVEFVKITSKPGWISGDSWEIVCKVVDGVYVLVGISPGLDEFVPEGFRYRKHSSGRRWRHH